MQLLHFTTPTLGCDDDHTVISSFPPLEPRLLKPRNGLCLVFDTVVVVVAVVVVIYHSMGVMVVERCYTTTFDFIRLVFSHVCLSLEACCGYAKESGRLQAKTCLFCFV